MAVEDETALDFFVGERVLARVSGTDNWMWGTVYRRFESTWASAAGYDVAFDDGHMSFLWPQELMKSASQELIDAA